MSRKPFPQFNPFRNFVMEELKRRKNTNSATPIIAPFTRFTSCMEDASQKYAFFSLGLHGYSDSGNKNNIFDLTYGMGRDVVGYAYNKKRNDRGVHSKKLIFSDDISADIDQFKPLLADSVTEDDVANLAARRQDEHISKSAPAAHPIPGITNISVIRRGLGQPLMATVNWQCYNQRQLEFLRNHFLCTGDYVVLEFGNQYSDKYINATLDFETDHESTFEVLRKCIGAVGAPGLLTQGGRQFVIEQYNEPNTGNYDFIVGQVSNFEVNIEPTTGIYKCTTKIVSQGENVWGIKIEGTYAINDDFTNPAEITSIKEYFELGRYWEFISENLNNPSDGVFKSIGDPWSAGQTADTAAESSKINQNDYVFMTWNFVMKNLLQDMVAVIKNTAVQQELNHYIQFSSVLETDYVGYHELLLSAVPETMLLLNKTISGAIKNSSSSSELLAAGEFAPVTEVAGQRAGKLNEGVLLNSKMVRESFMTAYNLKQAISTILSNINHAVGGYWQLQLFWDDELAAYRIIDYKFGTQHRNETFYKFNVGGAGECLSIEFDSAFPPELITQMNLVSLFQTMDSQKQQEYIKQYPLLGTTSAHMFMLNWSHLRDGLRQRVEQWRTGNMPASPNQTAENAMNRLDSLDSFSRISNTAGGTRNTPSVLGNQSRTAGEPLNTPKATSQTADNVTITPRRSSVKSTRLIRPSALAKLQNRISPLPQMTVRDSFSNARVHPITNKVRPHTGTDYRAAIGTPIRAPLDGSVINTPVNTGGGYGLSIDIDHGDGIMTRFGHLSRSLVNRGSRVTKGDIIGYTGNSGLSTGPHLHYEIRVDGVPVNPENPGGEVTSIGSTSVDEGPADGSNTLLPPLQPPSLTNKDASNSRLKQAAVNLRRAEVSKKFGDGIKDLYAEHMGDMINNITRDGYSKSTSPNQFVSPFPTTTSITVEIQGLSGISISDGFFVDKIPFLFEKHGVFQVTEIIDTVSPTTGWRTKIKGYFKMLWYDGNGRAEVVY